VNIVGRLAVVQQGRGREPEEERVVVLERQDLGNVKEGELELDVAAQQWEPRNAKAASREKARRQVSSSGSTTKVEPPGRGGVAPSDGEGGGRPKVPHLDARAREVEGLGALVARRAAEGATVGGARTQDELGTGGGGAARDLRLREVDEGVRRGHGEVAWRRRGPERVVFVAIAVRGSSPA